MGFRPRHRPARNTCVQVGRGAAGLGHRRPGHDPDVGRGHHFAAPPGVTHALQAEVTLETHGYYADTGSWAAALADWARAGMAGAWTRSGSADARIVSGLGLLLQAVSAPGDEVVVFHRPILRSAG